ncbi:MAG: ATP-binding protein [Vicinamibacterales bacterium]|jgi:signal transduction histidine kinase/ActR/RegA family two-component response regulator
MIRTVGLAGAGFILVYIVLSVVTGQSVVALGDLAQLVPPLAYAGLTLALAQRCRGQVRIFWNLNAAHAVIWAIGQAVWTYHDLFGGGVPVISPTDPIFFVSSLPLAAALYGRPERDRPRWLFDIVLLDLVLIALFSAFVYIYFVVSIAITDGNQELYRTNLTQLLNARNLLLALWGIWVWRTAATPAWRRMLGVYATGLAVTFFGGLIYDMLDLTGVYLAGALWDVSFMLPYAVLAVAAAVAYDEKLFEPEEEAPPLARLPVVSLIAITLLVAIPAIDEIARRLTNVSPATETLRTRLALAMLIPFGIVVVVREFLSRRALLRAGQELVSTREQLVQKEKLAAVGQLVSGVAHELNNPLQGVLGYAELMLAARPASADTEELRAIRDNANRAAGIVRNLLTFAGRTASARGWQQINRIVRDAVAVREPHLQASGIDLRLEAADRLPLVYVDHARLEDVLVNLIQNAEAAIATRREGKTRPSTVPARARGEIVITTKWQGNPDRILVEVADNGSGLREEDVSRVFDPFFTTREVGQGTGLGLSVCYGIIREHGGQITARNADVGGAVFTVELPVMAESLASATAAASLPVMAPRPVIPTPSYAMVQPVDDGLDRTPRRRKALVVDDEESNAALVRRVLAGAGYDVESTTLSRRALVMIERTAYDAVIADVKMPELSGQELYGRVCQIRPEMARRFIFITGDIDGEDTREFLDQSRCSYFMKPFNLERLTAAVDMLTGTRAPDTIG